MAQSYYPTAQGLIDAALGHIRAVDPEGSLSPTATMRTNALVTLNQLVLHLQSLGMQVWCLKNGFQVLDATLNRYVIGPAALTSLQPRPQAIIQAWLHNSSANTDPVPLQIVDRETYNRFTNKTSQGTPIAIFYDRNYDVEGGNIGANANGFLYVYPQPDATAAATYYLSYVYSRPIHDFSALSDSLDFPQEWYLALTWKLASLLCPSFGVAVMYWDRIDNQAEAFLKAQIGWDSETESMQIVPSQGVLK
jgi:hypothetical protein